ncbi:MAG TPA: hypothetical protein VE978_07805 [Chitinophagales bacterium]|nr:hypothetical protein [Chitinophagales bacterium]
MEYLIFLRLIHIVCTVIWAGGMIYLAVFVIPASKSLGPEGAKFIQQLFNTNKLPVIMNVAAIFSIVTGILLMQKLLGGIQTVFNSTHGTIIVIGALLALLGFIIGLSVNLPAARRMSSLGKIVMESGSQPNSGQLEELQRLRSRSFAATNVIAILLFASLILMSVVKYF